MRGESILISFLFLEKQANLLVFCTHHEQAVVVGLCASHAFCNATSHWVNCVVPALTVYIWGN